MQLDEFPDSNIKTLSISKIPAGVVLSAPKKRRANISEPDQDFFCIQKTRHNGRDSLFNLCNELTPA